MDSGHDSNRLTAINALPAVCHELKARFAGWRVATFVAHPGFARAFESGYGREPRITKPASNADLRGWFFLFER